MNERVPLAYLVPLRLLCGVILSARRVGGACGGLAARERAGFGTLERLGQHQEALQVLPADHRRTARAHPKIFGALVTLGELVDRRGRMVLGSADAGQRLPWARSCCSTYAFFLGQKLVPPGNALLMAGAVRHLPVFAPPGRVCWGSTPGCAGACRAGWSDRVGGRSAVARRDARDALQLHPDGPLDGLDPRPRCWCRRSGSCS